MIHRKKIGGIGKKGDDIKGGKMIERNEDEDLLPMMMLHQGQGNKWDSYEIFKYRMYCI